MLSRASHVHGHSLPSIALSSSTHSHGRSSAFRLCLNSLPIPFLSLSSSSSSPPQRLQFQSFSSSSSISSTSSSSSVAHPASLLRSYCIPTSSVSFPSLSGSLSSAPSMGRPSFSGKGLFFCYELKFTSYVVLLEAVFLLSNLLVW